ncbi:MAG TPA: SPFH domain-containing protein [Candidatus Acidoferrales bacterium]|nr:SPFH domain-containing protein [Candidatus Acidoferrales bacterium]
MNAAAVLQLSYYVMVVLILVFLFRFGKAPRTYLTDYMKGLRFVKGRFVDVLGPGGYKPFTRRVHIEVVDMRPVPFLMESISYRDALQSESVVSIGAEMLVDDPYLAATSLKHRISDSLPIVRETLRAAASRCISDRSPEFRLKMARDIEGAVNQELRQSGMKIANVEVTELFVRGGRSHRVAKGLN